MHHHRAAAPALIALAVLVAGCGSGGGSGGGTGASYPRAGAESPLPAIRPADFTGTVDNAWFPLTPGSVLTYTGAKDGKAARDVFTVTHETYVVDGVRCVVIHDSLYLDGTLEEKTSDWYAQDRAGNVWYFGESTAELDENGHVTSTEGSWQAGKDGATPGIFMPARPAVGQTFLQEYLKGQAEDHFQVLALAASVTTPATTTAAALLTKEWTPLEPGVVDQKYYVRGIGTVKELAVRGGTESLTLQSVTKTP